MNLKALFLVVTSFVVLVIAAVMIFSLHQAATEASAQQRVERTESDCPTHVKEAVELVAHANTDSEGGGHTRITDSSSHYNRQLNMCFIEVTTYERREKPVFVKTLVSPLQKTAILWTITDRPEDPNRQCFGSDAMPLDCAETDKRWKMFMTQ